MIVPIMKANGKMVRDMAKGNLYRGAIATKGSGSKISPMALGRR